MAGQNPCIVRRWTGSGYFTIFNKKNQVQQTIIFSPQTETPTLTSEGEVGINPSPKLEASDNKGCDPPPPLVTPAVTIDNDLIAAEVVGAPEII